MDSIVKGAWIGKPKEAKMQKVKEKKAGLKLKEGNIYPLAFYKNGDLIGYMEIKGGKLFFGGNLGESARRLFEMVKDFTMEYINKQRKGEISEAKTR